MYLYSSHSASVSLRKREGVDKESRKKTWGKNCHYANDIYFDWPHV